MGVAAVDARDSGTEKRLDGEIGLVGWDEMEGDRGGSLLASLPLEDFRKLPNLATAKYQHSSTI